MSTENTASVSTHILDTSVGRPAADVASGGARCDRDAAILGRDPLVDR